MDRNIKLTIQKDSHIKFDIKLIDNALSTAFDINDSEFEEYNRLVIQAWLRVRDKLEELS